MTHQKITTTLGIHLDEIRNLIDSNLKDSGDIESDSQKLVVLNRLADLARAVNGISEDDLK